MITVSTAINGKGQSVFRASINCYHDDGKLLSWCRSTYSREAMIDKLRISRKEIIQCIGFHLFVEVLLKVNSLSETDAMIWEWKPLLKWRLLSQVASEPR